MDPYDWLKTVQEGRENRHAYGNAVLQRREEMCHLGIVRLVHGILLAEDGMEPGQIELLDGFARYERQCRETFGVVDWESVEEHFAQRVPRMSPLVMGWTFACLTGTAARLKHSYLSVTRRYDTAMTSLSSTQVLDLEKLDAVALMDEERALLLHANQNLGEAWKYWNRAAKSRLTRMTLLWNERGVQRTTLAAAAHHLVRMHEQTAELFRGWATDEFRISLEARKRLVQDFGMELSPRELQV